MNGAESLLRTLVEGGVDACFMNPGTSEIHFVNALDRVPQMRSVPCLFEGVAAGAADGYARMTGKAACTLFHLGPGLSNALANLHNAYRAQVPMVNIVGEHATYHLKNDAPLAADIGMLARQYSHWLRTSQNSASVGQDCAEAIAAANTKPGGIATLILPTDTAWGDDGRVVAVPDVPRAPMPRDAEIETAARLLTNGERTAILLGHHLIEGAALVTAGRIAAKTGAKLLSPFGFTRIQRGAGLPIVERVPYVIEAALEMLKEFRQVILVGAPAPVAFFAYPEKPEALTAQGAVLHRLTQAHEDGASALDTLADAVGATASSPVVQKAERPDVATGAITLAGLAAVVGALLPENAIVVDESLTSGRGMMAATKGAAPHDWLVNTGGSIGIGLPMAAGAAVACPDRPVVCLQADGSGMYTLQALWTMARMGLNVTTVVFANRAYAILKGELAALGNPGPRSLDMLDIGRPTLDWVGLAQSMGVTGQRATTLDEFSDALRRGLASREPNVIEVVL
ncbi:MAG TPA: acetolactate synthase large subunit [Rhizomicrobium sp.]|jgi:acetolactate synthase-1/2/3 large subunit|nr:acetolactate synthase large subunit [Rhizomicrobium sp.]